MSKLLEAYLALEKAEELLKDSRTIENGEVYSLMDTVWFKLSEEDIKFLNGRTPAAAPKHKKRVKGTGPNDETGDVHTRHCCKNCGCKYSDDDCTVTTSNKAQEYDCTGSCWDY